MKRLTYFLASLFTFATILFFIALFALQHFALTPGGYQKDSFFIVKKGSGLMSIGRALEKEGYVNSAYVFAVLNILKRTSGKMKAGEYKLLSGMSPDEISNLFVSGKVYLHKFTVIEGQTIRQIYTDLAREEKLTGAFPKEWPEGVLMPDTYMYPRGESRQKMLMRMNKTMQAYLHEAWQKRDPHSPLETPLQTLILASIIEKEAALAHERPHVAAVFLNRLKKNMKFQSCATVIYAMTKGEMNLGRKLLRSDLDYVSPHNTYLHTGFPPTPICCPGRAAIEAALHPSDSKDLFFVVNGDGGHNFSPSYAIHNKNIREAKKNGVL